MKTCNKCNIEKNESEFSKSNARQDGYQYQCKDCQNSYRKTPQARATQKRYTNSPQGKSNLRNWNLKNKYNITPEQYEALLVSQDYKCAICRTDKPGGRGRFHVDHDHETGQVRGLLCYSCNTSLGGFKDDPSITDAATNYLISHQPKLIGGPNALFVLKDDYLQPLRAVA